MRASIKNYTEALKQQRIERGEDGGFSLIELIVVVVILGILAAIAIPIFLNIQDTAKQNSADTVAANAATQWAATKAQDKTFSSTNFPGYTIVVTPASSPTLDNFCVTATAAGTGGKVGHAGPGMTGSGATATCP